MVSAQTEDGGVSVGEKGFGYREITQALVAEIRAGAWPIGGQLPTEGELTERFGTSRNTVRESLRELELSGYIKRRRGTRSILVARDPATNFVNSVQTVNELLQYSKHTRSRLLDAHMVVMTPVLARKLGIEPGGNWLRITVLRNPLQGTLPIGYSEIYVAGAYAAVEEHLSEPGTIFQKLEQHFGLYFRRVEQTVEAIAATDELAHQLRVEAGAPLMRSRTEFITGTGEIAEVGFGYFPAQRYRIEIMLERNSAPAQDGPSQQD